jgi:hypothetical protein
MFVGVVLLVAVLRAIVGPDGFPKPADQSPVMRYVAMGIGLLVGLLLMFNGMMGIKQKHIFGAESADYVSEWHGGKAVLVGAGQCIAGTILVGVTLFGLFF